MASFNILIQDELVQVDILEENIHFEIVEDHIDVDIIQDHVNVDVTEDIINIDLVEDTVNVTLDGSCICVPTGGDGADTSEEYQHDGTLVIGDLVYKSTAIPNYVIRATDNDSPNPVIGIVTKVRSITAATVTHLGFFDVSMELIEGKKIYVSETGRVTSDLLQENYVQVLGVAISNHRIYLNPELRRCRRLIY